ncbi:TetR-like C-terminal domain-containing protein [Bacillus massilinigeriensis]|uniref:TetR-like C-terminal domain-containing protein n=1 Tax=Bacillus massilionigeriensis TaxID=1805475 RepID=UPI00096B12D7|nr:TetR-like C-terminal domain-containing protein [Bacillus massilionigeriensis]
MKPQELIIFPHILKNAHFYQLLVVENSIPKLKRSIIETIISILNHKLIFTNFEGCSPAFQSNTYYKAYGFYGMIHEWIKSNYQISPTQISKDLITILAIDNSKANIHS